MVLLWKIFVFYQLIKLIPICTIIVGLFSAHAYFSYQRLDLFFYLLKIVIRLFSNQHFNEFFILFSII